MGIMILISITRYMSVDLLRQYFTNTNTDPQMFTAGRYEYRNKGVDMFIESLARRSHSENRN